MATEKLITTKLLLNHKSSHNRRIQSVSGHVGLAQSGLLADGRHFVNRAREEAAQYQDIYRVPVPGMQLALRMSQYAHAYTLYSSVRPFGLASLMAVWDEYKGPQLFLIESSGQYWEYQACAVGKGRQIAKTELEKLKLDEVTPREAVKHAARIIMMAHDESKDREYELELTWICEESGRKHRLVPDDLLVEAKQFARDSLNAADNEMQE